MSTPPLMPPSSIVSYQGGEECQLSPDHTATPSIHDFNKAMSEPGAQDQDQALSKTLVGNVFDGKYKAEDAIADMGQGSLPVNVAVAGNAKTLTYASSV